MTVSRGRVRGRPKTADAALIDQQLLDVAFDQFVKHGYGATTMSKIIKAAGISKTTLYSRLTSKEQVFRAIMSRQAERFAAAVPLDPNDMSLGLVEGLRKYGRYLLETTLKGRSLEVYRLIYSESRRFPELGIAGLERRSLGIERVAAFIEARSLADGVPCRDARVPAEMFMLMITGWYSNIMMTGEKVDDARNAAFVDNAVKTVVAGRADW